MKYAAMAVVVAGLVLITAVWWQASTRSAKTGMQAPQSVAARNKPTEPLNIVATPAGGAVTATWEPPADPDAGLTYRLQYSIDFGASWNEPSTQPGAATSLKVKVPDGQFYIFRVMARNVLGDSDWSPPSEKVMPGTPYPSRPLDLTAIPGTTSVTLTWKAPAYEGTSSIVDYLIEYRLTGFDSRDFTVPEHVSWSRPSPATTQATITGLAENEGYLFRVSARNRSGRGFAAWTDAVFTAPGEP